MVDPIPLLLGLWNGHAARCRDRLYSRSGAHSLFHKQTGRYQSATPDSLAAMYEHVLASRQIAGHSVQDLGPSRLRPRNLSIWNRKRRKVHPLPSGLACFTAKIQVFFLVRGEQREYGIYIRSLPRRDIIFQPISAARTRAHGQLSGPRSIEPIDFLRHFVTLVLYDDVPGKPIYIHSPLAKNVNAMMSIKYSSIRPCFQTTLRSRQVRDS
jgi:hypothetical protein